MPNFFLLLNTGPGNYVVQNDGSSRIILNSSTVGPASVGSPSGGRVKKHVGHQLTDLGPRPHTVENGESTSKVLLKTVSASKGKLVLRVGGESVFTWFGGVSTSRLIFTLKSESTAKLYFRANSESHGMLHASALMEGILKKTASTNNMTKALFYMNMIESLDELYSTDDN